MAKQYNTYSAGPWSFKKGEVEAKFIPVTAESRKNACVTGRILYVISGDTFRGTFVIQPPFTKGRNKIPWKPWDSKINPNETHYSVFLTEDVNIEEHVKTYRALIDKYIEEKSLFINPQDKILNFYHE